jgi:hypothetical protein
MSFAPDIISERWFDECELALMTLRDGLTTNSTNSTKSEAAPNREAETCGPALSRAAPATASEHFVSEYLTRPLRTEAQARAARIPKARGLADLIAEQTGIDRMFTRMFGGTQ